MESSSQMEFEENKDEEELPMDFDNSSSHGSLSNQSDFAFGSVIHERQKSVA
jgi:hypothetical protein